MNEGHGSQLSVALEAVNVSVSLDNKPIVHNLNIALPRGRWTCLVGPNGAGKSTLLKAMAGLLSYTGTVLLQGQPWQQWPRQDRARQLAWLGQNTLGTDDLSVWDVAMLGRLPHHTWLGRCSVADMAAVEKALRATQAWDWRDRSLGQLSGGERQRVLLARALAVEASVLLMDEPLANLDPPHQADWLEIVQGLVQAGCTVLSVLHEMNMALQADELVILNKGQVLHQGSSHYAPTHRALEAVFENRIQVCPCQGQWVVMPRRTAKRYD